MKSRAFFFTLTTLIAIALLVGVVYLWSTSQRNTGDQPTTGGRNTIRINKTVQGEVTEILTNANIITVKDANGQEMHLAIVPETRITDEKSKAITSADIQKGFTVEGKGEQVTENAMIASTIRVTAVPEIIITSPTTNSAVTSPLTIEGLAKGTWYFEAVFPVEILDANRRSLGKKYVTATEDWMSESLVSFKGELEFQKPTTKTGYLVLKNDNPSGLKENEKSFELPINFEPTTMKVNVFFNNSKLDPAFLCDKVFPVSREIPWTAGVGRASIEELLKGVTEQERAMDYFTNINPNVTINNIVIDNGTARIDFSEELDKNIGGSCRVTAIRAQITQTLKQFPTVRDVIISINGRVDDILQP